MAFRTYTFPDAVTRVAADTLSATVPQPPTAPRKRSRVGSPDLNGRRRIVRKSSSAEPLVPVKAADEPWTAAENAALKEAVMQFGERKRDWPKVGRAMACLGRDKEACRKQWLALRPPVKGSWTEEEDRMLAVIVTRQGPTGWSSIAKHIAGRNAKQCRERWVNHLNPNVNKAQWSKEEDELLVAAHNELGNQWSEIAKRLKGRPDNAVKNRWYTLQNRANGGGRKRQRTSRRPTPDLASLLAKCARVDLDAVDEGTKATLNSLADRFTALAAAQKAGSPAPVAPGAAATPATARPPTQRRPSFHRRSVLAAAASAGAGAGSATAATPSVRSAAAAAAGVQRSIAASCDSLEFSHMSLASDVLRDAAINLSIDLEHSIGLESASFASDLLTALDTSLDVAALEAAVASPVAKADDPREPAPVSLASPAAEDRAAATPSPPAYPAPPARPRRNSGRRPGRTVTVFADSLLCASPSAAPALVSKYTMPEEVLKTLPLPTGAEASPLDDLSMNSLSLSLADLSFFQADVRRPTAHAPTSVALSKLSENSSCSSLPSLAV